MVQLSVECVGQVLVGNSLEFCVHLHDNNREIQQHKLVISGNTFAGFHVNTK